MSVGHKREYRHKQMVISETRAAIGNPKVKAYLERPFKINLDHHIPYTGGSSKDGLTYYLDRDLPDRFHVPVLWHERLEKALRDVLDMSYSQAHELATCGERLLVERQGKAWSDYQRDIARYVQRNLKGAPGKQPADLDTGPYRESGQMKLLAMH